MRPGTKSGARVILSRRAFPQGERGSPGQPASSQLLSSPGAARPAAPHGCGAWLPERDAPTLLGIDSGSRFRAASRPGERAAGTLRRDFAPTGSRRLAGRPSCRRIKPLFRKRRANPDASGQDSLRGCRPSRAHNCKGRITSAATGSSSTHVPSPRTARHSGHPFPAGGPAPTLLAGRVPKHDRSARRRCSSRQGLRNAGRC